MQRLSGIDSMFLSLESPTNLFQVGAVSVIDPSTAPAGSPLPYEALRRVILDRLHLLAPFRRRLVPVPGGLDHPRWIEDPDFDVDHHLHRGALPAPGGPAELARYAADVLSQPLDRTRPLWEIHVVEGLGRRSHRRRGQDPSRRYRRGLGSRADGQPYGHHSRHRRGSPAV